MATLQDARRAVLQWVDELRPFEKRTYTLTGGSATTLTSDAFKALPNDPNLFVGGFFKKPDESVVYCTAFDQATGTVTVTPSGSTPTNGTTADFTRAFQPDQVDDAIKNAWNEVKRKLWVPVKSVWTMREEDRQEYTLPTTWAGVSRLLYSGSPLTGSFDLDSFGAGYGANRSYTPTEDVWVQYAALYLRNNLGAAANYTVSLDGNDATISTVEVSLRGQWVVFDFGYPVKLTAGVTYTVGIPNNFNFEFGLDSDGLPLWALYRAQGTWREMLGDEWELRADRQLWLRDDIRSLSPRFNRPLIPTNALIQLEGIRYPAQPSETSTLEIPYDWLVNKVAYILSVSRLRSQGLDPDEMDTRLRAFTGPLAVAESILSQSWPSGTRKVMDSSP